MIDFLFALIAAGASASKAPEPTVTPSQTEVTQEQPAAPAQAAPTQPAQSPTVNIGENVQVGEGVQIGGSVQVEPKPLPSPPAALAGPAGTSLPAIEESVIPAGLVAEPQTPSGKFTTAAEIKPILNATRGNWVAIREYDGSDFVYVTQIWSWRCGMKAMAISINDEPMQNWPLPPCHDKYATPNALLDDDPLPYLKLRLGGVQKVTIQLVLDDLSTDIAVFERGDVLIP